MMDESIEERASRVLSGVPDWIWNGDTLPVPVEHIADSCFGLHVRDVADLSSAPGVPSLGPDQSLSGLLLPGLGEIWVNAAEARDWPSRRRFTIGHNHLRLVTITAKTGKEEISNLLVPNGTPGYEIGEAYRKMGWNASDTRPLSFEDCRIPEENLVGPRGQGFKQFLQTLDGGRIGVAAMGLGRHRVHSTRRSPTPRSGSRSASRSPNTRRSRPSSPTCPRKSRRLA